MKIKLYFDLNENIKKDWHSLENDNLHILPFHQYEWVKLYYDINRLKKNLTFLFILVYENEKLLLIFPFVVKKGLVNRIEYLGSPFNDINAPLYDHNSKIRYGYWYDEKDSWVYQNIGHYKPYLLNI